MYPKRTIPQDLLLSATFAAKFLAKVAVSSEEPCWPFTGWLNRRGYGQFSVDGRQQFAHRIAWALAHGSNVPEGMRVLHRCDNPPCCNPSHLFLGTPLDNMRDMASKGREPSGSRQPKAKLTDLKVTEIRARWQRGETQVHLANAFSVTPHLVWRIVHGRSWKHVP